MENYKESKTGVYESTRGQPEHTVDATRLREIIRDKSSEDWGGRQIGNAGTGSQRSASSRNE